MQDVTPEVQAPAGTINIYTFTNIQNHRVMKVHDYLICTFAGDTAVPPNTYPAVITTVDANTGSITCTMPDTGQAYTFDTAEPWTGADQNGNSYTLTSHNLYVAAGTDPSPQNVAVVTFSDGRGYLCLVDNISPSVDVTFYHQPYPRLSFDVNGMVTASDWDSYPAGTQTQSMECYMPEDTSIDPSLIEIENNTPEWNGADAPRRPYNVESWRPLVTEMAGDIPVGVLMRWITKESGGNPCSTGKIVNGASIENGIFQLYSPDDDHIATPAQLHGNFCNGQTCTRDLTLEEARIQVASGIGYVRACRENIRAALHQAGLAWDEDSADFWTMVKMRHVLPTIPKIYIAKLKPASWADFKAGVINELPDYATTKAHLFRNAEDIGAGAN